MTGPRCRCCGQDDITPAAGVVEWRGPLCVPCTVDHHRHTWIPPKSWEQIEEEQAAARWRGATPSVLGLTW